jgi:antibiotic biosynthesis monooxygenase (ABM) superfamily enzyme
MSPAATQSPPPAAAPQRPAGPPPRHKLALVVWLAIYPTITLLLHFGGPVINDWALPLRTLALTGVVVPTMVFLLLPGLQRVFAGWLRP